MRYAIQWITAALASAHLSTAFAQPYPTKPVHIITAGAGGGTDFVARLIAQGLTENLGQPMVVENRGGSGVIAAEYVAKAAPDGYTLLFATSSLWVGPLIQPAAYDVMRDFAPISLTAHSPNVLVVHPSLPVHSVRELIALARARPGELNYAASVAGSSSHLAMELFKRMAGIDVVRISYKTGATETTDLIAGQVQFTFGTAASMMPLLKWGKVRGLAVTSAKPSPLFPGLPTVAADVAGYETGSVTGLFAPAKTPPALVAAINREIVRVLTAAEVKQKLFAVGVEPVASSSAEFSAALQTDIAKWRRVISEAGIRAD